MMATDAVYPLCVTNTSNNPFCEEQETGANCIELGAAASFSSNLEPDDDLYEDIGSEGSCSPLDTTRTITTATNATEDELSAVSPVGEQSNFAKDQTVVIFDWDDTLLPSTWLSQRKLTIQVDCVIPLDAMELLNEMSSWTRRTLEIASTLGTVIIVTNAEHGWIELSCRKFMPGLAPFLAGIKQLSARTKYETRETQSPFVWKQLAFRDEILKSFEGISRELAKNLISFGDSAHERMALIAITRVVPTDVEGYLRFESSLTEFPPQPAFQELVGTFRTKSVKFIELPSLEDLKKEHDLIVKCMYQIVQADSDLDLCIKCMADDPPQESAAAENQNQCFNDDSQSLSDDSTLNAPPYSNDPPGDDSQLFCTTNVFDSSEVVPVASE